jgi:hypothetical protein
VKEIPLSQGKVALVDDDDFERVSQFKWSYIGGYAKRSVVRSDGKRRLYPLHRFIMGISQESEFMVDHVNLDKLDCRKENLRVCTKFQNNNNHGPKDRQGKSTSRYKGVSYKVDARNKWRARIGVDGVEYTLGYFSTEEEAAIAYNNAAIKYFGEFAWLNDVPD